MWKRAGPAVFWLEISFDIADTRDWADPMAAPNCALTCECLATVLI